MKDTTLAQADRSVLLLESRSLPRFHVGESLLPRTMPVLEELGVMDRVKSQGYVVKYGAEFIADTGWYKRIQFRKPAFRVERAHFDNILVEFAAESEATVLQEAPVHELLHEDGRVVGVRYQCGGESRTVRAGYVVYAGGRASKVAKTFDLRRYNEKLRMVGVFQHLKGLDEQHNPGNEGDIQVGAHQDGWLWAIPIWPAIPRGGIVTEAAVPSNADPLEAACRGVSQLVSAANGPLPGAEPFTYVGETIAKGQSIGIIEVMKLMIPVEADRAGRVSEVLVGNGEPVEFGQPLLSIVPETVG